MQALFSLILMLFFGFFQIAPGWSQVPGGNDSGQKDQTLHPVYLQYGLDTLKTATGAIESIDSIALPPYKIIHFSFKESAQNDPWPYGSGYLIADDSSPENKVIWFNLIYGDYGPHTFSWIDFDGDGDKDLYHLSGFEDVFASHLFLNQINTDTDTAFTAVYTNELAYCALVDMDKDGIPEILNQVQILDPEAPLTSTEWAYELETAQNRAIAAEYDRIVGTFDESNFNYNMPDHYKKFAIGISAEVNILTVMNGRMTDVSKNYPDHFCFRNDLLGHIKDPGEKVQPWLAELEQKYSTFCR